MDLFNIISTLIALAALFGYVNVRFLKLPSTIGLMIMSITVTSAIIGIGTLYPSVLESAKTWVQAIDFETVLMDIMLSFLLFAGALHTDLQRLKEQRWPILIFSTLGVLASTFIIGTLMYFVLGFIGMPVAYIHALLFGALISPTDPIAVLGILKQANAPKKLEIKIVGESLFNDGIGVVIFLTLFSVAQKGMAEITPGDIIALFGLEVFGGILLGAVLGYLCYLLLKSIDHYETEVMLTLALVMGGYVLAGKLHVSGPLAMVVAGLFIGNQARETAFSELTERYLDKFWELVDVLLNAVLFVLIGLEILIIHYDNHYLLAGLLAIPLVLLARYVSLGLPVYFLKKKLEFTPNTSLLLTWGGLRGGISIALALSLSPDMDRNLILTITYIVVVFSIIVQGLSVGKVVKRLAGESVKNSEPE